MGMSGTKTKKRLATGRFEICVCAGALISGAAAQSQPTRVRPPVEIEGYLHKGYPFIPVALHGLSLDWPIDLVLSAAVRADQDRARIYFNDAARIVGAFPDWRCTARDGDYQQSTVFESGQLKDADLETIIRRYFDNGERLTLYPDWFRGASHVRVPPKQLSRYVDENRRWYASNDLDPGGYGVVKPRPVVVSLYERGEQILIDADRARLEVAVQNGLDSLPVVIWYNDGPVKFISQYGPNPTARAIIDAFFEDGATLTLVPQLGFGDYHLVSTVAELKKELDYVPDVEDVNAERFSTLQAEFDDIGFRRPLPVALFRFAGGRAVRAVESDRIAVAEKLGIDTVPVAFYFVDNGRKRGGERRVDCNIRLCEAAGGNPLNCSQLPQFVEWGAPSPGQPGGAEPRMAPPGPPSPPPQAPPGPPTLPPPPPAPPQVIPPPPPASP